MKLDRKTAAFLESSVRAALAAGHGALGGVVAGQVFEQQPLLAAALAFMPHWNGPLREDIENFFDLYGPVFLALGTEEETLAFPEGQKYAHAHSALVGKLVALQLEAKEKV